MSGIEEFTPAFFDEASHAWRANKVPIGEGSFRYKRNAFSVKEEKPKKQQLRRSPRLQLRLRFTRELAALKK